jgi:hypothetical protein
MNIFKIETTPEDEFKQFIKSFAQENAMFYDLINMKHQDIFNKFWNSQYDHQLIADTLGFEKAVMLFQLSFAIQEILKADPGYKELIPPKNVDFSTGTILITDKNIV